MFKTFDKPEKTMKKKAIIKISIISMVYMKKFFYIYILTYKRVTKV